MITRIILLLLIAADVSANEYTIVENANKLLCNKIYSEHLEEGLSLEAIDGLEFPVWFNEKLKYISLNDGSGREMNIKAIDWDIDNDGIIEKVVLTKNTRQSQDLYSLYSFNSIEYSEATKKPIDLNYLNENGWIVYEGWKGPMSKRYGIVLPNIRLFKFKNKNYFIVFDGFLGKYNSSGLPEHANIKRGMIVGRLVNKPLKYKYRWRSPESYRVYRDFELDCYFRDK